MRNCSNAFYEGDGDRRKGSATKVLLDYLTERERNGPELRPSYQEGQITAEGLISVGVGQTQPIVVLAPWLLVFGLEILLALP